jgi:pimeloyl-ACP methyl ester carboxylesterase
MPTLQANGLTLAYETHGDPAGAPLLLVMGLGAQLTFWPEELVEGLAAEGFRVIRFDNRDAGLSTALDTLGVPNVALASMKYLLRLPVAAPYLIRDMALDTHALLDALGIARAHVVGASMGGMIAQELAAEFPDRVASLVSIMSTTGSRKLPHPTRRARAALLAPAASPGDVEGAIHRLMGLLRAIGSTTHPAEEGALRAFCERQARRSYRPAAAARQLVAIAASGDRTANVRRIRAPTLVIHGDEDPLVRPPCGEATAAAIRAGGGRAELRVVAGMGHDLPLPLLPSIVAAIAAHCRAA